MGQQGFTLVELLLAMAISAILAGAIFLLVDAGVQTQDSGDRDLASAAAASQLVLTVRGDVARADQIQHASGDSLAMRLADNRWVSYGTQPVGDRLEVYRKVKDGGSWVPQPLRPLAVLRTRDGEAPQLSFQEDDGIVITHLQTAGWDLQFGASPWIGQ